MLPSLTLQQDISDVSAVDESNVAQSSLTSSASFEIPSAPVGAAVVSIPKAPFSVSPTPLQQQQTLQYQQQQQQQQQHQQQHQQQPPHFSPPLSVATNHFMPPAQQGGYNRPGYVSPSIPSGSPVVNTDPRVKDSIELCSFAIAALKVNGC